MEETEKNGKDKLATSAIYHLSTDGDADNRHEAMDVACFHNACSPTGGYHYSNWDPCHDGTLGASTCSNSCDKEGKLGHGTHEAIKDLTCAHM